MESQVFERKAQIYLLCILLGSLIYSKFLLSVSMILLVVLSLTEWDWKPLKVRWRPGLKASLKGFWKWNPYMMFTIMIVAYVLSGLWSSNVEEWFWRVRTKAPFLFLPLAFYLMRGLKKEDLYLIWRFLVLFCAGSLLLVLTPIITDTQAMVDLIRVGKAFPTPCHHVRYSLIIALSTLVGLELSYSSEEKNRRWLFGIAAAILGLGLHVLAVRSGLLSLYLGIWVWLILRLKGLPRILASTGSIILFVGLLIGAYNYVPSFKQKVDYVKYDWEKYQEGGSSDLSDSDRINSLIAGFELFKRYPITGVGIGDLKQEIKAEFDRKNIEYARVKFPHNQYLFVLSGAGLIGLILFLIGFLGPLWWRNPKLYPVLYAVYAMILASFLVENTIENAVGTGVTMVFILLAIDMRRGS